MPLKNKETGEPPRSLEQLKEHAAMKEREYENTLLKKSLAEGLQQVTDDYLRLSKQYSQLLKEYEDLLQKEEKNRNNWQEQLNKNLFSLLNANQQLQSSINQKVGELAGDLQSMTVKKVESVTQKANNEISDTVREFAATMEDAKTTLQAYATTMQKEMKDAHLKISSQYRAAFGIGLGWKILMASGSVAAIAMLVLKYIVGVV